MFDPSGGSGEEIDSISASMPSLWKGYGEARAER